VLNHLQRFKMLPIGMRGIGDAAFKQSIGEKQMAELVADDGNGGMQQREQGEAQGDGAGGNQDRGSGGMLSYAMGCATTFRASRPTIPARSTRFRAD
jgi:hypothetical protein